MRSYTEEILMKIPGRLGRALRYNYYKSKFKTCGKNIDIWDNVVLYGSDCIEIGNCVAFGRNSVINGGGGLKLGSYILMGPCCFIWTVNHDYNVENMWNIRKEIKKPVIIEDNVWISANVKITPGVTVGTGTVLGMGSVVTKDVPPYCVVGGNPATILKRIKR
ncbi:galactoside O-acetyltransferase [Candidatus Methanophagaceae archaeon]|nr:galactoside O-acetyltransferase [Methanophagales archaeon]